MSAVDTLRTDSIGHNSGNLVFAAASHALLSTDGTTVDTRGSFRGASLASKVNDEYDGIVLPLANCFRPAFVRELEHLSAFIEGLKIPFAMLSGGAQVEDQHTDFDNLKSMEEPVKRFCRAVLSKWLFAVRGE